MTRTLGVKALLLVPVLFIVSIGTFFMVDRVPGDPAFNVLGPNASRQDYLRVHHELGFDKPVLQRYGTWLNKVLHGDLGRNLTPPVQKVATMLHRSFPVNIELAILALLMAFAVAIPLGMWSAYRPGSRIDRIISAGTFATISVPSFLAGVLLVLI